MDKLFDPKVDTAKFVPPVSLVKADELMEDLYPNLLCQDMDRKLARWFESKLDAKATFRRWYGNKN